MSMIAVKSSEDYFKIFAQEQNVPLYTLTELIGLCSAPITRKTGTDLNAKTVKNGMVGPTKISQLILLKKEIQLKMSQEWHVLNQ